MSAQQLVVPVFPDGDAAGGALASALTRAFARARDGVAALAPGDAVVLLAADEPAAAGAVAALTRSLALEWAPDGIRVNAVTCAGPGAADDVLAWLAARPALMLTGAVLEAA